MGGAFGLEGMNGVFPNMGLNGATDFSQMMQFMPNAMPNAMMGAFPNMMGTLGDRSSRKFHILTPYTGMPAMGMDPMAMSQAMYGGFGGPSMGMNGMNMGMGFNAGQGAFGGFNGQTDAWNSGQNNFNPNAYGNVANGMSGNFGTQTGYGGHNMPSHQGNFSQMNHQQFPSNDFQNGYNGQGFQNRGRGRRGGYNNVGRGRGGYYQAAQGNYANQANHEPFHHQLPSQATSQNTMQVATGEQMEKPKTEHEPTENASQELPSENLITNKADEEQINKELNPGDEDDKIQADPVIIPTESIIDTSAKTDGDQQPLRKDLEQDPTSADEKTEVVSKREEEPKPVAIQTYISSDEDRLQKPTYEVVSKIETNSMPPPSPAIPLGPAAQYSRDNSYDSGRGRGSVRGYYGSAPDIRGGYRGRSVSYLANGHQIHTTPTQISPITNHPAAEPRGQGVEGAPKGPKALREGLPNIGLRGRGFSIVGRAAAAIHHKPNESTKSRRYVPRSSLLFSVSSWLTLTVVVLRPQDTALGLDLLLAHIIDLVTTEATVTDREVFLTMTNVRDEGSATHAAHGSMKMKNEKVQTDLKTTTSHESGILHLSRRREDHIEAIVIMTMRILLQVIVIIATAAEIVMKNVDIEESVQRVLLQIPSPLHLLLPKLLQSVHLLTVTTIKKNLENLESAEREMKNTTITSENALAVIVQ